MAGSSLATIGLYLQGRKAQQREKKSVQITDQPVKVESTPKRFNAALAKEMHEELERRVDRHDEEIEKLSNELNGLSAEIRDKLSEMPGKIVVDILNAQKLGRKND
jgi:hypothetical protein